MAFLVLAVLVALATATTVWLIRAHAHHDVDSTFWYGFTGACVLAPVILIPALNSKVQSIALLAICSAVALATRGLLRRQQGMPPGVGLRTQASPELTAISAQHDALVSRWIRYELDPALAIDFPAMTDIRHPETSALIRAVAAASRLKAAGHSADDGVASYRRAVTELSEALATAERAARRSGTVYRGHPTA